MGLSGTILKTEQNSHFDVPRKMSVSYRLVSFGIDEPAPVQSLARLHVELLPMSPVALLGRRFMEKFYYLILPRDGLIFGTIAYVEERPAGFVAATHDPSGFMRSALHRRWPCIVWVVGSSLILAPKSMGAAWEAWRVMQSRSLSQAGGLDGEILSLGVLPEYRELSFIRQTGLRISTDLLSDAVARLRARGIRVIRATVSADNTPVKLFYSGLGWTFARTNLPGWQHPTVEFIWRD
jgi:ribosomal protein S18 acetylase RimI-like enzyme